MKIRVKHKETEFIVEDDERTDTYHNLIWDNKEYVITLLKEITENIVRINNEK
jgi:hypothetical protein